jgi:nitroreductase
VDRSDVEVQSTPLSLMEGICTTRAIRRYIDDPVPDRLLRDVLFAASRAPSGSNRQPFRFVVLRDGPTAVAAKQLIATAAASVWPAKKQRDRYKAGSGATVGSPSREWRQRCRITSPRFRPCPC